MDWINQGKEILHIQLGPRMIRFRRSEIEPLLSQLGS